MVSNLPYLRRSWRRQERPSWLGSCRARPDRNSLRAVTVAGVHAVAPGRVVLCVVHARMRPDRRQRPVYEVDGPEALAAEALLRTPLGQGIDDLGHAEALRLVRAEAFDQAWSSRGRPGTAAARTARRVAAWAARQGSSRSTERRRRSSSPPSCRSCALWSSRRQATRRTAWLRARCPLVSAWHPVSP